MFKNRKKPQSLGYQSQYSRKEWLVLRRGYLGGSDAGVALGVHPYKCALDLYLDKIKGKAPQVSGMAITVGNDLEPYVIQKAQQARPDRIKQIETLPIYRDDEHFWMLATTDAGVAHGKYGKGLIEAKTAFSKFGHMGWVNGEVPAHYRAQCVHYMHVTQRSWCVIAALTEGPNFYHHVIEYDPEEAAQLVEAERQLWQALQSHDFAHLVDESDKSSAALAKIYAKADAESVLDLRDHDEANALLATMQEQKAIVKEATASRKLAENKLKTIIGSHEIAVFPNHEISWKQTANGTRRFITKDRT